jgi:hypothetical protein
MSYVLQMRRQGGHEEESGDAATVRYSDLRGGAGGLLAEAVVLKASALPDPPPDEIRVTVDWVEAAAGPGRRAGQSGTAPADTGEPASPRSRPRKVAQGERVEVVKSRVSGVKSPPEWLEQYVGRTGIVLWTTADGAMVDLDADTTWFSYAELEPKD